MRRTNCNTNKNVIQNQFVSAKHTRFFDLGLLFRCAPSALGNPHTLAASDGGPGFRFKFSNLKKVEWRFDPRFYWPLNTRNYAKTKRFLLSVDFGVFSPGKLLQFRIDCSIINVPK